MAVHGAQQKIHEAVLSWPRWISGAGLIDLIKMFIQRGWSGVTAHPHRFGGTEYRLGKRELGHIHGDQVVDIPFPKKVRDKIIAAGRAEPHHVLPESGWISFYLNESADIDKAIGLFRQSFELAEKQRSPKQGSE